MKALISAFALLSFVAASTVPYAAQAQTQAPAGDSMKSDMAKKPAAKKGKSHKAGAKSASAKKSHHKAAKKKTMSPASAPKG
ncbi:MAG TPA: hypothetical protein VN802_08835 [Stellaceae bacterium]|nr:hypothetical protein [Stellaceae bacterium]